MMTIIRRTPAGNMAYVKGAPDVLLPRCTHRLGLDGHVSFVAVAVFAAALVHVAGFGIDRRDDSVRSDPLSDAPGPGLIARFDVLHQFGLPLLIGLSRKRFIASVAPAPPDRRIGGSIAGNILATMAGAAVVRTHDVAETVQALRVADAIRKAR